MTRPFVRGFIAAILAAGLCAPIAAHAQDESCGKASDDPNIIVLAAPPCAACAATKAEVDELAEIQQARTKPEAEHALADYEMSVPRFLAGTGIELDPAKFAGCEAFFKMLSDREHAVVDKAKLTFCRPRPYQLPGTPIKALKEVGDKKSYAYPSGHTTYATLTGEVLAEMLPEKKREIYARIADYGHSRMVAGVHFRSDVEAGKILGASIAASLFASDEFRRDFENSKACLRRAAGF